MAKATIEDMQALGFGAAQFGSPADWAVDGTGYLARLLADVSAQVSDTVGAGAYAAATSGITFIRLRQAEEYLAAAELWRRRRQFLGANLATGRSADNALYLEQRECEAQAERCEARAWEVLGTFGAGTPGSTLRAGYVQSGPFTAVTP